MFSVPSHRLNLKKVYPTSTSVIDASIPLQRNWIYLNRSNKKIQQRGFGIQDLISEAFKGKSVTSLVKDISFGRIGTAIKTKINRLSGVRNAVPAFEGERHAFYIEKNRQGRNRLLFANYMGPGTNLLKRIRRGDKPINSPDRVAMGHDARYFLATNIKQTRRADQIFVKKLKQIRATGKVSKINTDIGLRGIQLKMKLENTGLLSKSKFIGPIKSVADRLIVSGVLRKLEQQGFGRNSRFLQRQKPEIGLPVEPPVILPGAVLKKKILRKLGKKGKGLYGGRRGGQLPAKVTPLALARLLITKMLPAIIQKIKQKTGINPINILKTLKDKLILDLAKRFKQQKGGFVITIAGVAALAGLIAAVSPIAVATAKFLIPKIIDAFTRKKGRGINPAVISKLKGLLVNVSKKVMVKFIKALCAGKQVGSGISSFIKSIGKKFVSGVAAVLKTIPTIAKFAGKIAIATGPIIIKTAPIILKKGLPILLKLLAKIKK